MTMTKSMSMSRPTTAAAPRRWLALVGVSALLGACATPSTPPTAPAPVTTRVATTPPVPAPAPAPPQPRPAPQSDVTTVTLPAHLDPKSDLSAGRSVFFDFDDAKVKSEFTPLIERHGRYLAANAKLAIRVEGNTDERGSAEYNLALGQKRAESVRKALSLMGVPEARIEAVSWGKERPRNAGHDESAWGQNRRADLQYPGK
jgi:peptidoglycan-associated lipoprotein